MAINKSKMSTSSPRPKALLVLVVLLVILCSSVFLLTTASPPEFKITTPQYSSSGPSPYAVMSNDEHVVRFSTTRNITYPRGTSVCAEAPVYDPDTEEIIADDRCYLDITIENYVNNNTNKLPFVRNVECVFYDLTTLNFDHADLTNNLTAVYTKTTSAFNFTTDPAEVITPAQYDEERDVIFFRHFLKPDLFYTGSRGDTYGGQVFQLHCEVEFDNAGVAPPNEDPEQVPLSTPYDHSPLLVSLNGQEIGQVVFAWAKSANAAENLRYITNNNNNNNNDHNNAATNTTTNVDQHFFALTPRQPHPQVESEDSSDLKTIPLEVKDYIDKQHLYTLYDWSSMIPVNFFQMTAARTTTTQSFFAINRTGTQSGGMDLLLTYTGPGMFLALPSWASAGDCAANGITTEGNARDNTLRFDLPDLKAAAKHFSVACHGFKPLYIPAHLNAASYTQDNLPNDKFLANPQVVVTAVRNRYMNQGYLYEPAYSITTPITRADLIHPVLNYTPAVSPTFHNTFVRGVRGGVVGSKFAPGKTDVVASFQLSARNITQTDEYTLSFAALSTVATDLVGKNVEIFITPFSTAEHYVYFDMSDVPRAQRPRFVPNVTLYDAFSYKQVLTNVSMDGVANRTTTQLLTNDIKFNPWELFTEHPANTNNFQITDGYLIGFDITVVLHALTVDTTQDLLELQMTSLYQNTAFSAQDNAKQLSHTTLLNVPIYAASQKNAGGFDMGVFRFNNKTGMRFYINNPKTSPLIDLSFDFMGSTIMTTPSAERREYYSTDMTNNDYNWSTHTANQKDPAWRNKGFTARPTTYSADRHWSSGIWWFEGKRFDVDIFGAFPHVLPLINRVDPAATTTPHNPFMITLSTSRDARHADAIPLVVFVDPTLGSDGESVESSAGNVVETKFTTMSNKDRKPSWVEEYRDSYDVMDIIIFWIVIPVVVAFLLLVLIIVLVLWCCGVCCFKKEKNKDQQVVSQELQSEGYAPRSGP